MEKRKQSLVYAWSYCLSVFLVLLAGCSIQTSYLPSTPSPGASRGTSASSQATADVILNLVGTYAGNYQWHGSSSSAPMRLEITEEEAGDLTGFCILGDQRFPLVKGITTIDYGSQGEDGGIMFMVNVPSSQQTITLNFSGVATKEGSMTGDVSASDGKEGSWSVKKA
jgi:hypothetical protein